MSSPAEARFETAVRSYWQVRDAQAAKQVASGKVFLLEESPRSTTPVRLAKTVFPVERIFENTSYKDRYRILCQRLMRERLYDAACFATSSSVPDSPIDQPDPELSFNSLRAAIAGRAAFIKAL